jgi:hypothetical protein
MDRDDEPVLVARWGRGLLVLTRRRLVVTRTTRVLHRTALHLNANLRHLSNISWSVDVREQSLVVNLTAVDGVREQFVLRLADLDEAQRAEALFRGVVHPRREDFAVAA